MPGAWKSWLLSFPLIGCEGGHTLPSGSTQVGFRPADLQGSPSQLLTLPPEVHDAVIQTFARSLHAVYLAGIPVVAVALLLVLLLQEKPLRKHAWVATAPAEAAATA